MKVTFSLGFYTQQQLEMNKNKDKWTTKLKKDIWYITFYYLFIKLGLKGYGRETKNVSDVSHHHKYSVCRRG